MSGFLKRAIAPKQKTKMVRFDAFSTGITRKKGVLNAVESRNCDCGDGRLKNGLGIELLNPDIGSVGNLFFFNDNNGQTVITGIIENGEFYEYSSDPSKPIGLDYRQRFSGEMKPFRMFLADKTAKLLAIGKDGVYEYDSTLRRFLPTDMDREVKQAIVWQNRLFCALEKCELIYTSPANPTDFTVRVEEGGSIFFPSERGEIVGLEALNGDLYIFYEYGVARLKTAGSPRDFTWEAIGYFGGKIIANSAKNCGDTIFFLAEDGAYRFNGRSFERIGKSLEIQPKENGDCVCAVGDGQYYAVYQGVDLRKHALALDCQSGEGYFFFLPDNMSFWQGQVFVYYQNRSAILRRATTSPSSDSSYFISEETDFSMRGLKRVKRLIVHGKGHCVLTLKTGDISESFEFRCLDKIELFPSLRGEKFSFSLQVLSDCDLRALEVETVSLAG